MAQKEVKWLRKVLFCFGVLLSLYFASNASAVEYGNIGGYPAHPDPANARSKSIFIHTLEPGSSVQDGVKVVNYTNEPKTLLIYATDSIVSSGGAFGCAQQVDPKHEVGNWINLAKSQVSLPAQSDQIVPFTITAPQKVDVGEHDGCIVIQEKNGPTQQLHQSGGNIQLSFRTAIRVALLIPGEIIKHLSIVDYTTGRSHDGNILLKPRVKNDGNVSLDTKVTTTTHYLWGPPLVSREQQFPILRGTISDWNIEVKRPFWGGWLTSRFSVTYDANTGNTIGSQTHAQPKTLTSKQIIFFTPPKLLALIIELLILLALAAFGVWLYRRRQQQRLIAVHWKDYKVKARDDIRSVAVSHDTSWKLLAKTNKLRPPYALQRGDMIKVPPKPKPPKKSS